MFRSTWYQGNIYIASVLKILVALILLFLSRILIYFFNPSAFSGIDLTHLLYIFLTGLRFDLFTLIVFNCVYLGLNSLPLPYRYNKAYQIVLDVVFCLTNSAALALNFIDVIYFRFSQKRMTIDMLDYVDENSNEIVSLIPVFIRDFWFMFVLWMVFVFLLVWVTRKIKADFSRKAGFKFKNYLYDTVKFIVIMILQVIIIRGGLQYRPINIINAGEYTEPKYFPVLLNTPFTLIKTKDKKAITPKIYFTNKAELDEIFTPVKSFHHAGKSFNHLNIVIIILESFTAEHSGYLNQGFENGKYKGYTPFLDSLMQHSLVFKGYANGEKSIDGIPAILCGIPALMTGPFITSPYAGNAVNSIASILKTQGYNTAFYHGGTNGTMGFESFTKIAGFDQYYGRYEYNNENDFDGKWGIFDEPFLQYTANQLSHTEQPFLATVFTLSSHHPYTIPEKYKGVFSKGKLDIHESIGYSDFALRRFFKTISGTDWFDSTLFVMTADHTYQGFYPYYQTSVGRYSVPIVFYQHGKTWDNTGPSVVQQTDIFPSILDYLGYEEKFIAFGQSIFEPAVRHFAVSGLSGIYQLISEGHVLKFDGERDVAFYNLELDSLMKNNIIRHQDSVQRSMSRLIRAVKQQFDQRIINNDLTIN